MSPDVCDCEGTPLVTKVIKQTGLSSADKSKCLELLLREGVDIEVADSEQLTPLHHAIRLDDKDLVTQLIDNGAPFIVEPVIRVFCEKEEKEDKKEDKKKDKEKDKKEDKKDKDKDKDKKDEKKGKSFTDFLPFGK